MSTPMLEIEDLHVAYGQVEAVRGVTVTLAHSQIVSVIGPNGAGKTTLLAAVIGLLPSKGRLRFDGEDLAGLDVEARVERGLTLVPLRLYFKGGKVKVAISLAKGKQAHDKREAIKKRETDRETRAAVKMTRR